MSVKKMISIMPLLTVGFFGFAQEASAVGKLSVLVAYFSWSSAQKTKGMAEKIAEMTGGELFRIAPAVPYTTSYNEVLEVAQKELSDSARPELAEKLTQEELDQFDIILVGYPVWWYDAPMIIYSFLESLDFSGKTVIPFATSGGSGISDRKLRAAIDAEFKEGLCISGYSGSSRNEERIRSWLTESGLL